MFCILYITDGIFYLQAVQKIFYITCRRLKGKILFMLTPMGPDYMFFNAILARTPKFTIVTYKGFLLHMYTHDMSSHFVFSIKAGFTVWTIEGT